MKVLQEMINYLKSLNKFFKKNHYKDDDDDDDDESTPDDVTSDRPHHIDTRET